MNWMLAIAVLFQEKPNEDIPEVKITAVEKLGEGHSWGVLSPDDKEILLWDHKDFALFDLASRKRSALYTPSKELNSRRVLASLHSAVFSPEGRRVVVLDQVKGRQCVVVWDRKGDAIPIEIPDAARSPAFAKDEVLFLAGEPGSLAGKLCAWDGEKVRTIHEIAGGFPGQLRVSPDRMRAAILVETPASYFVRVLDLATRKCVDSEKFVSRKANTKGWRPLFWDVEGKGLFYNATAGDTRDSCAVAYFDVERRESRLVSSVGTAIEGVLDKDWISLVFLSKWTGGLVRLRDGKPFRTGEYIIRLKTPSGVVATTKSGGLFLATVELPK